MDISKMSTLELKALTFDLEQEKLQMENTILTLKREIAMRNQQAQQEAIDKQKEKDILEKKEAREKLKQKENKIKDGEIINKDES